MADEKPAILLHLDVDPRPSVFDSVVAIDAGVDHLLAHGGVVPADATALVHGALFTRGPAELRRTAVFIGGSDVDAAERLKDAVVATFFGPFRVSVLLDPSGANTTAAAAVLAALRSAGGTLDGTRAAVLGATGPVGRRVASLLLGLGASVRLGSRRLDRAAALAETLRAGIETPGDIEAFETSSVDSLASGLDGAAIVVAAGAAGATLLPLSIRDGLASARVVLDLNAVPPLGVEWIEVHDRGVERDGTVCWGALGVGGIKMKIHKAAVRKIFESNDRVIDAAEVLALGRELGLDR
ncbi:MAG: bifunctional NADP-dependent methylenetetrahydromethanopterin dehydrogenase/methylenetetrahydrofolate dehydrogenase [Planctomycetota bacterium]|nr:bifunctional NADP-dependent methylenetetrahydromethanopterin dehydrogenase/methylenetetrahydrofolate dehydrogenase [Planctomycetota bacterium]